jgi:hypothetical protein
VVVLVRVPAAVGFDGVGPGGLQLPRLLLGALCVLAELGVALIRVLHGAANPVLRKLHQKSHDRVLSHKRAGLLSPAALRGAPTFASFDDDNDDDGDEKSRLRRHSTDKIIRSTCNCCVSQGSFFRRQNTEGLTLVGLFMEGTTLTCLETYSDAKKRTLVCLQDHGHQLLLQPWPCSDDREIL